MRHKRARHAAKTHKTSAYLRAHVLQLVEMPEKDTLVDIIKEPLIREKIVRTCGLHHIAPERPRALLREIEAPDFNGQGKQSMRTNFMSTEKEK